jgi:hypothetical protein
LLKQWLGAGPQRRVIELSLLWFFEENVRVRHQRKKEHVMKRGIRVGVLGMMIVAALASAGSAAPRDELKDFMRAKLKHSQRVLEGLVMEDFDEVAKGAQEMSLLSLAASWQVLQTPEYLEFSRKFRAAADSLGDKAKKKDLSGATTAYNQLTTRCVECHKYVRGVRMADAR